MLPRTCQNPTAAATALVHASSVQRDRAGERRTAGLEGGEQQRQHRRLTAVADHVVPEGGGVACLGVT
jgi:hypothetical protein